ncbi:MAG: M1 family aminopeptidase, partial [Gemmatimonadaceae bacterium]
QRIAVRDFNWDSTSFIGRVATTLVSRRTGLDSVILDADKGLVVRGVTGPTGATLRHARYRDTLVVRLAKPVAFGDTVRFTIDYDAHIISGHGLTYINARPKTPRQIWSQGESMENHNWFPTYDFPNDKMTWEVDATVPAGDMAVSNGSLVGDTPAAGGSHTLHWSQQTPSATYLVSLIVEPMAKVHDSWHNVPVDAYVYRQDSALARPLFHITVDMIDVYSRLTGIPYPWAKYAQTTVADFFGGMENVSATTLVDWLPDARAYRDRPWYQYTLIPHELAHQWFGDYVTTENWANTWLNEGFAEFMPGQYWTQKLGTHAGEDYYANEYPQYMGIEARRPMPLASMGSNNIYPKGALVLEMLHTYLGDARFWAGLHRYLVDHAYGGATSDDLRQAFLQATGENLNWFWSEWIYSAGHPSFTVTAKYDAAAHKETLIARQTQRDSLPADSTGMRYPIPEAFRMPVTVRVGTKAGDVVHHAWIRQREDTVVVDSVMSAPTMVVFDDANQILKALTFDQPTAWLATPLRRDPNLWNRGWVIGQLAKRTTDAAAGAALGTAATGADYFQTRVTAAAALAAFPAETAVPALDRAMRDTSSAVRAAAVSSLGELGGDRALALARTAWKGDSSYNVRAEALTALVRLDPAGRQALITEGLSTPSYTDVIQNAALVAVARTNDTTLVDAVQRVVGDQALPSQVLVAFSARGNQHALELLTADLDDSRSWVRGWTLAATGALGEARQLTLLQGVLPHVTHADTRKQISAAIDRLQKAPRGER